MSSGQRTREVWQDHLAFLDALRAIIAEQVVEAVVVAGDFNQRLPRDGQPHHVFDALLRALAPLRVVTAGEVEAWSRLREDGLELSDHDGLCAQLVVRSTAREVWTGPRRTVGRPVVESGGGAS